MTNSLQERVADVDDVGVAFNCKIDDKLFRHYTKNSKQCKILKFTLSPTNYTKTVGENWITHVLTAQILFFSFSSVGAFTGSF